MDGVTYSYQTEDPELAVSEGDIVVFRYKDNKQGNGIDRNSLGVWIDPATYNQ